jgi:PIN domain nuclease of toxin-antitoxin system
MSGAMCTVVNWAEVATKVLARGGDWQAAEVALVGAGLSIIPVEPGDAVRAARLWLDHPALSLSDRLCLAVGLRLSADIMTADHAWRPVSGQVSIIRRPGAGA